jgi:hypothetical protein
MGIGRVTVMEPGVKIAAAAGVLLGGILVAMLFRRDVPGAGPAVPASGDRLVLREQLKRSRVGGTVPDPRGAHSCAPFSAPTPTGVDGPKATILTPTDPGQPPPALGRDYPGSGKLDTSGWGASLGLPPLPRRDCPPRTHTIVDGDTLRALAERYLGSADRYLEIYEANRDVLPSPELLPIGAELRIPPWRRQAPLFFGLAPERPLVPIPHRAARAD